MSRRGGAWNMSPFMPGDGFFPPLLSPAGGGGRRRRPGVDLNPAILGKGCRFVQPHSGLGRWGCPESRVHRLRGRPPVRPGTRSRAACEFSPAGTKENSPGLQPANPRHAYIGFRQGQEKTGFAPRANRVPKGRKRIAPGFNPGIHVAPRLSPGGTTESASYRRCIWDLTRSRAA